MLTCFNLDTKRRVICLYLILRLHIYIFDIFASPGEMNSCFARCESYGGKQYEQHQGSSPSIANNMNMEGGGTKEEDKIKSMLPCNIALVPITIPITFSYLSIILLLLCTLMAPFKRSSVRRQLQLKLCRQ